jgi:hypothetical protein
MAQTGFTPISLYYSATASAVPLAANLTAGELALNTNDGKLYYKNSGGTVSLLASNAATTNVSSISFGSTGLTPATATTGAVTVAGTLAIANGGTNQTAFTTGQIHYGSFATSANLFYDSVNIRFGVGTSSPAVTAALVGTDAMLIPKGTTAQQPTGVAGYLRFNTTTSQFEGHNGTTWASVGGAAIVNDVTTASFEYPLFAAATSGNATTVYTGSANLLYKPSTGELQAQAVTANNGMFMNTATIAVNTTIASGYNAGSFGPVSVATGITVTVPSGSTWSVV